MALSTDVLRGGGSTVIFGKMIRLGVAFGFGLGEAEADLVGLVLALGVALARLVIDGFAVVLGFAETVGFAVVLGLADTEGFGVGLPAAPAGFGSITEISKPSARHAPLSV